MISNGRFSAANCGELACLFHFDRADLLRSTPAQKARVGGLRAGGDRRSPVVSDAKGDRICTGCPRLAPPERNFINPAQLLIERQIATSLRSSR